MNQSLIVILAKKLKKSFNPLHLIVSSTRGVRARATVRAATSNALVQLHRNSGTCAIFERQIAATTNFYYYHHSPAVAVAPLTFTHQQDEIVECLNVKLEENELLCNRNYSRFA